MPIVAPHGGAWIETISAAWRCWAALSPLTEGRGLKHDPVVVPQPRDLSPLTEGRGLKLSSSCRTSPAAAVAPHGGAWIETWFPLLQVVLVLVAPHGGAWIETPRFSRPEIDEECRPSRRGVD